MIVFELILTKLPIDLTSISSILDVYYLNRLLLDILMMSIYMMKPNFTLVTVISNLKNKSSYEYDANVC